MTGIIVTTPPTIELPPGSSGGGPNVLPPVTYLYAVTNIPQTWTAKQTFPLGMISLNVADITGIIPTISQVNLEQFSGGIGIVDNSAALNAAIASTGLGAVRVLLGSGVYRFTTTPALIAKSNVIIEGSGEDVTILQWSSGTLLEVNSGFSEGQGFQLRNLTLYAPDIVNAKIALKLVDQSQSTIENVKIIGGLGSNSLLSGSGGAVGIYSQGREFLRTKNVTIYADIPIRLGMNPNHYIATDHYNLSEVFLIGGSSYPIIQVDAGVVLSNLNIDNASFDLGTYGFYWNDTGAANAVAAINNGGSGYVAGEVITLAGGTKSTTITIRVVTVAAGVITSAAIANPGVYTVLPAYPASQASTTGVGTGATFTLVNGNSTLLSISNSRLEQGTVAANFSIYISPSATPAAAYIDNIAISNVVFDQARKGIYLRRSRHATLSNTWYNPNGATLAVDADTSNEALEFNNCRWITGCTESITLPYVRKSGIPTGETSGTALAPFASYSNTVTSWAFQNITSTLVAAQSTSPSTGYIRLQPGDGSHTGYVEWYDTTATRHAYLGYDVNAGGLSLTMSQGAFTVIGGGLGYGVGSGGTITQGAGSGKATAVTLNMLSGEITMNNAALAAGTIVTFAWNNTLSTATDTLVLNHVTTGTRGAYSLNAWCQAGSIAVDVRNNTAGSLSEAIVIRFALIKGANT